MLISTLVRATAGADLHRRRRPRWARRRRCWKRRLSAPRVVKAFGREEYEVGRYGAAVEESFRLAMRRARLRATFVPLITLARLRRAGRGALVRRARGAGRADHAGPVDLADALYDDGRRAAGWAGRASTRSSRRRRARRGGCLNCSTRVPDVAEAPDAVALPLPVRGAVTFAGVNFAYGNGPPVLHGRQPGDRAGRGGGAGRPQRRGQDHPRQPDPALL